MPNPPIETNRLRTLLTACVLVLLMVGTVSMVPLAVVNDSSHNGIAIAQEEEERTWCFDESFSTNWEVHDDVDAVFIGISPDQSTCGTHSLNLSVPGPSGGASNVAGARTKETGIVNNSFNLSYDVRFTSDDTQDYWVQLNDSNGDNVRARIDPGGPAGDEGYRIVGSRVTNAANDQPIPEDQWISIRFEINETTATMYADGSEVLSTSVTGDFSDVSTTRMEVRNQIFAGDVDVATAYTDNITIEGYTGSEPTEVDDDSVDLDLDVNEYMGPGSEQAYAVTFRNATGGFDVTNDENTTVTSSNSTTLSVRESDDLLIASQDENISEVVTVTANFTDTGGEQHTTSENVTVAQATMKNFDILPSAWRLNAMFSFGMGTGDSQQDTLPMWIFLTILVGVGLSALSTSFGGIGGMTMMMVVGWVAGYVGDGVMLATVFVGLFIGFNLAANIDYAVRRG